MRDMVKQKNQPASTEQIVVVFGTERLASAYARRMAINPRRIILAANGADKLQGATSVTTVRYPDDWWEPSTHPCTTRVREVEEAIKVIKKAGGEIIEYREH